MTPDEFNEMKKPQLSRPSVIHVSDLCNKEDRTLIWGYTCDRDSFHVYLEDEMFHKVVYGIDNVIIKFDTNDFIPVASAIPSKRVYPEASDFEFCMLIKEHDYHIPFTNYNIDRKEERFYGKRTNKLTWGTIL